MEATPLLRVRQELGLTKQQAIRKLKRSAEELGQPLFVTDESINRQMRYWEQGSRIVPEQYHAPFCAAYGRSPAELGFTPIDSQEFDETSSDLNERLQFTEVDSSLVELFENQTQNFRLLDRRLGAERLFEQTSSHVQQIEEMLKYAVPGDAREMLAAALAEASALSGWQALDMRNARDAWQMHEIAKTGARESENPSILAHVTAQQGYVLLDAERPSEALTLVQRARSKDQDKIHPRMRSWLAAAEGEMRAAAGDVSGTYKALDEADRLLPNEPGDSDPELPFLALNSTHLARWRGHCLARLGAAEAVNDLNSALSGLAGGDFRRAEAGARVDLAMALKARGEEEEARKHAKRADELAGNTGSARQRARIQKLQN
ncbi:hypothetical protein SAMN04487905_101212 [Actinopolyspora xinjiangensis]|uniref:HTH cro/C1-type domain-containing protein n=1 Tax=Actinopolyspora xinjiangensis TaxID=405564 RepID=A0A1H0NQC9_9ACTN|nr:hypothetical protein [Actinopolyspora xinjiangensis]SDO94766.1 hypothetical protein SAMN04487905_101212 [Actinopolyspora xinjiangensis]